MVWDLKQDTSYTNSDLICIHGLYCIHYSMFVYLHRFLSTMRAVQGALFIWINKKKHKCEISACVIERILFIWINKIVLLLTVRSHDGVWSNIFLKKLNKYYWWKWTVWEGIWLLFSYNNRTKSHFVVWISNIYIFSFFVHPIAALEFGNI